MTENAIIVENLSKRYLIGHRFSSAAQYKYTALRDVIGREIRSFARKATDVLRGHQVIQGDEVEEFWALKDVSFEVKQGEVLGIIGRNGAGKSTLLKILSRITEPTKGRVVLHGRVGSLLEVGTGFHPELTGRENIFLNGAILGMTQFEIRKKFDEIVAFAEVEKFLDIPVKHYSSGMYVRLAFAVAAHLEPEILVVDEVLAVGDVEFQKKCLRKMDEASRREGRTVLFVSHNMDAIIRLCTRGFLFEAGRLAAIDQVTNVVSKFMHCRSSSPTVVDLTARERPDYFRGKARLTQIKPSDQGNGWSLPFGQPLSLDLSINAEPYISRVEILVAIYSARGFEVATWTSRCDGVQLDVHSGVNTFRIEFQDLRLLPGQYFLGVGVGGDRDFDDWVREAVFFEVRSSPVGAEIGVDLFRGAIVPTAKVSLTDARGYSDTDRILTTDQVTHSAG